MNSKYWNSQAKRVSNPNIVVYIGDGSQQHSDLAAGMSELEFHGLLDRSTKVIPGAYHTSIYDCDVLPGDCHAVLLVTDSYSIKLAHTAATVEGSAQGTIELLSTSRSFCIYPFTSIYQNGTDTKACCFMDKPITQSFTDFVTDPDFNRIRQQMLTGQTVPECAGCIYNEHSGGASQREMATLTYASDYAITEPRVELVDYDIRIGNRCNLKCRMCSPSDSNIIDREYASIGLTDSELGTIEANSFDIIDVSTASRVYFAGGEPTINPEVIKFMQTCVDAGNTDFDLVINTNAAAVSKHYRDLALKFDRLHYYISVDNYGDQLNYTRNPIKWNNFVQNLAQLVDRDTKFAWATTVNIYNIGNLYNLFAWQTSEYPNSDITLGFLVDPEHLQAWLHPDREFVIRDIERCKTLEVYKNDKNFQKNIDMIYERIYTSDTNKEHLKKFFVFNDLLDYSRQDKLKNHFPELEKFRV